RPSKTQGVPPCPVKWRAGRALSECEDRLVFLLGRWSVSGPASFWPRSRNMLRIKPLVTVAAVLASLSALQFRAAADEIPEKYKEHIRKGLDYLAKTQQKDGHWAANGDHHPVAM